MMRKILISIVSDVDDEVRLNQLYDLYEAEGFKVEIFDIERNSIEVDHLPEILNYIRSQNEATDEIRVTILSNILPLLLSWYRCYNSLANDFILFVNNTYKNLWTFEQKNFVTELSTFNNIDLEKIEDKIFLSLNSDPTHPITEFLLFNNRYVNFTDIGNFNFMHTTSKKLQSKTYEYKGIEYKFLLENSENVLKIKLENNIKDIANINLEMILSNHYFTFYGAIRIYRLKLDQDRKNQALHNLFKQLSEMDDEIQHKIHMQFITYIQNNNVQFHEKIYFLSLLVMLNVNTIILEEIMDTLKNDYANINHHYPLLINSLSYMAKKNLERYPNLYSDRKFVFDKIVQHYKPLLKLKKLHRTNKKVAIIAGQTLDPKHAPTMATLNYVKGFKEHFPEYEVKVFSEDLYVYSPSEIAFPYSFQSHRSETCREVHSEYLGYESDIYYSDASQQRTARIQKDVNKVIDFQPELLLVIGFDYSFISAYLRDLIPVINFTLSTAANPSGADVYIGGYNKEDIMKEYSFYNISGINYHKHTVGLTFPDPQKKVTRNEFKVSKDDYVMITVGNRLDADMSESFIDLVCNFIYDHKDAKWLIVGVANHNYIKNSHSRLINQNRIVLINYYSDLAALYSLCNVFLNPFRQGGGFSGYMAMKQSLPVVSLFENSDVGAVVGEVYSSNNKNEYEQEMIRLYSDSDYYRDASIEMKRRISEDYGFKKAIEDMITIFELAKLEYNSRT